MLINGPYFGKYGVQSTFYFAVEDVSITDAPFVGVAPVAADIWIIKDGGVPANATNGATAEGNGVYSLVLTAAEMQASVVAVSIYDATASEIFKPTFFTVITRAALGTLDIDATQVGGNTSAITATGVGTGYGLQTSGASASYYHNAFAQLEGSEPSAAIGASATFGSILQFLKRRFFNKNTVSGSALTTYKDDAATSLQSQAVSDNGSTQTLGAAS